MANKTVRFSASLQDELGTKATTVAYGLIPEAQTLTQVATAQSAWVAALDAITDAAITGSSVTIVSGPTGTDKGAGAGKAKVGSRVEQTGVINYTNATNVHPWGEAIPAFTDSAIAGGKVDLTNAAVSAFIAIMTGALSGGNFTNPYLQAIVGVKDAILSFRERRRQLQRSSYEVA